MAKTKTASEKRNERKEQLEAAIEAIQSEEQFQAWLRSRAMFHSYSFWNSLLIAFQCPNATRVTGFRSWQKLGRQVRKGEKGIQIWAPRLQPLDELDENGEPKKRIWFKAVYVFDVSQTEGDELPAAPEVAPITGDSHAAYLPELEQLGETMGYPVSYKPLARYNGYCDPANKIIVIDEHLAPNAKVATLVHEIVHAAGVDYVKFTRPEAEAIAEASAYVVCQAIGLETADNAAPYIATWATADDRRRAFSAIDHYAAQVENALGLHERETAIWEPAEGEEGE